MTTRPLNPVSCRLARRLLLATLATLVLGLGTAASAQGVGSPTTTPGSQKKPSPFKPSSSGGGGGGSYTPPGDVGGPGGDGGDDDGGTDGGNAAPSKGGVAPGGNSGRQPAGASPRGSEGARGGGGSGAANAPSTVEVVDDRWETWWEANKFDFIELRRVEDPIRTGQGTNVETPEQRELRLAGVRATIRGQILPVLRSLAGSDDTAVRSSAVVALGKLRDEASVDLVRDSLGDSSFDVRRSSMLALGVLDSGRASWLLMNIADDSRQGRTLVSSSPISHDDRGIALLSAALRGDVAAEPLLMQMLSEHQDMNHELLSMVACAAGLMGSSEAIRPLIDIAFDQALPQSVRSAAATALGRIGDPSVTPALMELLEADIEPRRAAAVALGLVGHPSAERVLDRLAEVIEKESDAATRHFAAISLGRIGGPAARTRLLAAFAKPHDDMRPWLALALGVCERSAPSGDIASVLLERMKKESNADTQSAYLIGLGLCRSPNSVPELVNALRTGPVDQAGYAALALGLSGQAGAAEPLREALTSSPNVDVLRQTALALGILGDTASIPALLDLIRTTNNPFVGSYAAIGVAFMGEADAAGPLLALIEKQGPLGVSTTYAAAAVGALFDSDRRPALSRLAAGDNYLSRPVAVDDLLDLGF